MVWTFDESAGIGGVTGGLRCGCALCAASATEGASSAGLGLDDAAFRRTGGGTTSAQGDVAYYISALLPSYEPRWGTGDVGTAASVDYSFMSSAPFYADSDDRNGFAETTDAQKEACRQAFALWAAVCDITFTEVTDGFSSDIRIATNDQGGVSSGYAYYPGSTYGGDVYFSNDIESMASPSVGSWMFSTVIHELGHAIGLKHPGDYNAGGGGTEGPYLPSGEDSNQYSVMSYNDHPTMGSSVQNTMPSIYDIAAVQYLYGANTSYATGNDTYSYSTSSAFMATIWDAGGTDTIDAGDQTLDSVIYLTAGSFSSIGVGTTSSTASDNVAIAYGVTIENATGGSGNDVIVGNTSANVLTGGSGDDTLTGGSGNDTLIGGSGTDIAVFSAARSNYEWTTATDGTVTITHLSSGSDGTDTLTGIETLRFSDQDVTVSQDVTTVTTTTTTDRFSAYAYAAHNADLYAAFGSDVSALEWHYISSGRSEGRTATGFDPYGYVAANSDLHAAFGTNTDQLIGHYINYGQAEGRSSADFDPYAYAATNADLYAAFGTNTDQLVSHYINYGQSEGRTATGFDPYAYAATNTDLYAAFGVDIDQLINHYVNYGQAEGRSATGFDVEGYATTNSDLYAAFGSNADQLVGHYVNYGRAEGRDPGVMTTTTTSPATSPATASAYGALASSFG